MKKIVLFAILVIRYTRLYIKYRNNTPLHSFGLTVNKGCISLGRILYFYSLTYKCSTGRACNYTDCMFGCATRIRRLFRDDKGNHFSCAIPLLR
jgi:hypothetical protein